eukprot:4002614-Pyramimonas_sp.AAC.1
MAEERRSFHSMLDDLSSQGAACSDGPPRKQYLMAHPAAAASDVARLQATIDQCANDVAQMKSEHEASVKALRDELQNEREATRQERAAWAARLQALQVEGGGPPGAADEEAGQVEQLSLIHI